MTIPSITVGEKIYVAPNLKGKTIRKALELLDQCADGKIGENDVDTLVSFLCDLYGNKFDISDVYGGIPTDGILTTVFKRIRAVVQMFIDASNQGASSGSGKEMKPIEAINQLYRVIIKQGWTLPDIDESDFLTLMGILIEPEEKHYISEIF